MGLNERTSNFVRKVMIKHHAFCIESKTPVIGFTEKDVPNPKDKLPDGSLGTVKKWIKTFGSLDGVIRRIEWYDTENKVPGVRFMGLNIYVEDLSTMKTAILDLPLSSSFYTQFTKQAGCIDFDRPVEFNAWHDKRDAEHPNKTAFMIKQGGAVVGWAHTKNQPNGMPQPKNVLGKWNYDDQNVFLHSELMNKIVPERIDAHNQGWQPTFDPILIPDNDPVAGDDEITFTGPATPPASTPAASPARAMPPPITSVGADDDIPF